jgi:subtilisin family serine protease
MKNYLLALLAVLGVGLFTLGFPRPAGQLTAPRQPNMGTDAAGLPPAAPPTFPPDQKNAIHPVERTVAQSRVLEERIHSQPNGVFRRERLLHSELVQRPAVVQEDWRFDHSTTNWLCQRRDLFLADQFILRIQPDTTAAQLQTFLGTLHLSLGDQLSTDLITVRSPQSNLTVWHETLAALAAQSQLVVHAEADGIGFGSGLPNDPSFASQWGCHNTGQSGGTADADVDAPEFWDILENVNGVVVAVLDSGLNFTHPDLQNLAWTNSAEIPGDGLDNDANGRVDDVRGWDFTNSDNDPTDDHGHGSNVTGIMAANRNNNVGVAGLVSGARILVCKILNASNAGLTSHLIAATTYARQMGAPIMNLSLQNYPFSSTLNTEFTACQTTGILLSICAGNQGVNNDVTFNYPSCYQQTNIIAVGNHDRTDVRWSGAFNPSNYGATNVDLFAPGRDIYSPILGTSYSSYTGTSQATPFVTALAAALKALHPAESAPQLRQHLVNSVVPRPAYTGICTTGGRLNAVTAIGQALKANPQADFDGDGFGDFHEYLAGTRVDSNTSQPLTTNWLAGGFLHHNTPHAMRAEGNLRLEFSTNLVDWTTSGIVDLSTSNMLHGAIPLGPTPLGFLRLQIQAAP